MPVEAKPLFRPDVVRNHVASFKLPAHVEQFQPTLEKWKKLISSARGAKLTEKQLLPEFLTDFFGTLLGYAGPATGADRYTISREQHVKVDGKFADAVLGEFNGHSKFVVAVEGKGLKDPLDIPHAGRKMSAVDQGYRYAINLPCDWIIVTSMKETRLYHKGSDQHTFEVFETEKLADDVNLLKRFVYLFGAARVVPPGGLCHFRGLLSESEKVGRELTREFYILYANIRQDAFEQLAADNATISRHEVLTSTQKLLDRVLFCAFCEDRGLLPTETLKKAYDHRDPYHPRPIWENFRGLFSAINTGNAALDIYAFNGGLFAQDPVLDHLIVSDKVCEYFSDLGNFDYQRPQQAAVSDSDGTLIDVEILGHIFEQSITDLEKLRNELDGLAEPVGAEKHKTRRKKEGAFYTPEFITRYIIEQALGGVVKDRFEQHRQKQHATAKATAKKALDDPNVYVLDDLNQPQKDALLTFWESWQDELKTIRILDLACGSGAFLVEAFDQLLTIYEKSNERLEELRGHRTLFDLGRQILEHNLYGVDLNEEAIEICRLSLWIKTAEKGKPLTSLDHSIRVGNSVVSDPSVHPKALDWQAAFPEVFAAGGFDVVVGNPPYVRQEWLSDIKPYLQANYQAFHGMADLYVYFYELGCRLLKPGGRLSYVVTNKWMKASYGEPLRRFFTETVWTESVIDFGHAKQIFVDADVFPSIIVVRKPTDDPKPQTVQVCAITRETLRIDDLSRQIESEGFEVSSSQLGTGTWQLEPRGVNDLFAKILRVGTPLQEFTGGERYRGVTTGLNTAFLIDSATKTQLCQLDPKSVEIIKPYLRGQDIARWVPEFHDEWMLFTRRGIDIERYPAIKAYLESFRSQLEPKPKDWSGGEWPGRKPGNYKWYELQDPVDFHLEFEKSKIYYQEIQFHPCYAFDDQRLYGNNKTSFIISDDLYLLSVLNSPLMWWFSWRYFPHMKDEALGPNGYLVAAMPIAVPVDEVRSAVQGHARRVIEITKLQQTTQQTVLDWLKVEYEIEKPSLKLQAPLTLDSDAFVAEVKKVRGKSKPLTAAALKALRDEDAQTLAPARALAAETLTLERQLSDLVNAAYGLTPEEVQLLWDTAPPRMPISPP